MYDVWATSYFSYATSTRIWDSNGTSLHVPTGYSYSSCVVRVLVRVLVIEPLRTPVPVLTPEPVPAQILVLVY